MPDGNSNIIKCIVTLKREVFYKEESNFGILSLRVEKELEGKPFATQITVKGQVPKMKKNTEYHLVAEEVDDDNYGKQYKCISLNLNTMIEKDDTDRQRKYLEALFTKKQVKAMYDSLENPYETLEKQDIASLVQVKGIGIKVGTSIMNKFKGYKDYSLLMTDLGDFNLTDNMMKKLTSQYGSVELAVNAVKNNPYSLLTIDGIGWKTCDTLAMRGGLEPHSKQRVEAFLWYYLEEQGQQGYSYLTAQQLMDGLVGFLGEDVPDSVIAEALLSNENKLWWSDDKSKIGLRKYKNLEDDLAREFHRILKGKNTFSCGNIDEIIKSHEESQGWEFTDEQKDAIGMALNNQLLFITGYGGTGKSTVVEVMLKVIGKGRTFAQCALAGKAAARLFEVTGEEGSTIHRLLGFPKGEPEHFGFFYHEDNQLDYDIIIVDEISMIDGYLFLRLLKAIKTGTKVVLLGDIGQLEAIGSCNVAKDLLDSPYIPSIQLTKIHRQAQKSAIITDSIKIRNGQQIVEKDFVGQQVRGELEDVLLDCYSDRSNTFYKIMQHFQNGVELVDSIYNLQIIVPIKDKVSGVWNINNTIQELYNPKNGDENEIWVNYDKTHSGVLRVGDKVLNTKNHYGLKFYTEKLSSTINEEAWDNTFNGIDDEEFDDEIEREEDDSNSVDIFNGFMGKITKINKELGFIVVDFQGIGEVLIGKDKINSIMLGYAITCHKCQGSQFERVIYGVDYDSYTQLTREQLYTAITRATKHCTIVAQNSALRYGTFNTSVSTKQTHLLNSLYSVFNPKIAF